jgi:hypothetical protein
LCSSCWSCLTRRTRASATTSRPSSTGESSAAGAWTGRNGGNRA